MNQGLLPLLGALVAFAASACAPDLTCDETFTGGGNFWVFDDNADGVPNSTWVVTEPCEDIVSSPPLQDTLVNQPPHLSGEAPPDPGSGDWCMNLSFSGGMIKNLNTWFPRLPLQPHYPIAQGQKPWYDTALIIDGSGYALPAILSGRQKLELSDRCLTSQGVVLTCDELTGAIAAAWNSEPAVKNLSCHDHPSGSGCECDYDMVLNIGPAGTWYAAPGSDLVTFFDGQGGPPFQANYRLEGNSLSMNGYRRRALFGINGLRTLKFERVICNDGLQGPGEDGVDVGPYCAPPPAP